LADRKGEKEKEGPVKGGGNDDVNNEEEEREGSEGKQLIAIGREKVNER
jgi:hypothetical protein